MDIHPGTYTLHVCLRSPKTKIDKQLSPNFVSDSCFQQFFLFLFFFNFPVVKFNYPVVSRMVGEVFPS